MKLRSYFDYKMHEVKIYRKVLVDYYYIGSMRENSHELMNKNVERRNCTGNIQRYSTVLQ